MFKDIMVHLDQSPACENRLEAAIVLAKQHGAKLTGLYVYSSLRQKDPTVETAGVRKSFDQHTQGAGLATEFLDVDLVFLQTGVAEIIGYYASFTDLLIVSQPLSADRDKQH